MRYNLIINPSHQWQQSVAHGLSLYKSMIDQGHEVISVFFYGDAAQIAADNNSQKKWLNPSSHSEFLICRTMIETHEIFQNVLPQFNVVGMGKLASNMEQADRTVEIN
jgi:sulfur relay (sulfurtransferase) complex TusBCD TusD component (DsrE family)